MKIAKISLIVCAVMFVIGAMVWRIVQRDPISEYECYSSAKIVLGGGDIELVEGSGGFVLIVKEGVGASKTTTAHGYWDTIYIVLPEKPVAGISQATSEVYRGGYRRGSGWAVDPDADVTLIVEPVTLNSDECKFRILGFVPLRVWWPPESEDTEGNQRGELGGTEVIWRPHTEKFRFREKVYVFKNRS